MMMAVLSRPCWPVEVKEQPATREGKRRPLRLRADYTWIINSLPLKADLIRVKPSVRVPCVKEGRLRDSFTEKEREREMGRAAHREAKQEDGFDFLRM